ncbi:hypothetical protein Syun_022786 [Stephania yunnanensis]|uniref:Uncharacterized protein n=1 Tax=Stephania yunnanensis TaxID=152371 RepID=A0AAP0FA50_9MAGN
MESRPKNKIRSPHSHSLVSLARTGLSLARSHWSLARSGRSGRSLALVARFVSLALLWSLSLAFAARSRTLVSRCERFCLISRANEVQLLLGAIGVKSTLIIMEVIPFLVLVIKPPSSPAGRFTQILSDGIGGSTLGPLKVCLQVYEYLHGVMSAFDPELLFELRKILGMVVLVDRFESDNFHQARERTAGRESRVQNHQFLSRDLNIGEQIQLL